MRRVDTEGRQQYLEDQRREINEALIFGDNSGRSGDRRSRHDDFGPPWGFASLGDYYMQNGPYFRRPQRAA